MIVKIMPKFGLVMTEMVHINDRVIEVNEPIESVRINGKAYPAEGNKCKLPDTFQWGMGANSLTIINAKGNHISCGMITRSKANLMRSEPAMREILMYLLKYTEESENIISEQKKTIDELMAFCKYPDII